MADKFFTSSDNLVTENDMGHRILITAGKIQNIVDLTLRKDISTETATQNLDRLFESMKSQLRMLGSFANSQQTREQPRNVKAATQSNGMSVITHVQHLLLAQSDPLTSSGPSAHQAREGGELRSLLVSGGALNGSFSCVSIEGQSINRIGSESLNSNAVEQFPVKMPVPDMKNGHESDEENATHQIAKRQRLSFNYSHPAYYGHGPPHPYECIICPKRFTTVTACKRHQLTHTKPFVCTHCDHRSAEKTKIRLHCLKRHGDATLFTEEDRTGGKGLVSAKENQNFMAEIILGDSSDEDLKIDDRAMRTKSNNSKMTQSTVVIVKAESDDSNDPLCPIITGVSTLAESDGEVKFIPIGMQEPVQFEDERSDTEDYVEKREGCYISYVGTETDC